MGQWNCKSKADIPNNQSSIDEDFKFSIDSEQVYLNDFDQDYGTTALCTATTCNICDKVERHSDRRVKEDNSRQHMESKNVYQSFFDEDDSEQHYGNNTATCHICGKIYDGHPNRRVNEDNLRQHMESKKVHQSFFNVDVESSVESEQEFGNNAVICHICGKIYDRHPDRRVNEDNLRQHMASNKATCGKVYDGHFIRSINDQNLRQHMESSIDEESSLDSEEWSEKIAATCHICGIVYDRHHKRSVNEQNLRQHMESKKAHQSSIEEYIESSIDSEEEYDNNAATCHICGKTYDRHHNRSVNEQNLRQHMESEKAHQSSIEEYVQSSENGINAATCHICGKVYDGHSNISINEHNLRQHKRAHQSKSGEDVLSLGDSELEYGNNAVTCHICGKVFDRHHNIHVNEDNLRQHMKSKKAHQVSSCSICYKVFENEKKMMQHMRSKASDRDHMPEPRIRDIACPICGEERFGASDSAVAHVESGACSCCKGKQRARQTVYSFISGKGLQGMLAQVPQIKSGNAYVKPKVPDLPYRCSSCRKTFAEVSSLMQHQKHKHGNPGNKSLMVLQK